MVKWMGAICVQQPQVSSSYYRELANRLSPAEKQKVWSYSFSDYKYFKKCMDDSERRRSPKSMIIEHFASLVTGHLANVLCISLTYLSHACKTTNSTHHVTALNKFFISTNVS